MTDTYKEALCQFIQQGKLTISEVEEMVAYLESTSIERSRQTPTWVAAERLCKMLHDGIAANSYRPFKLSVTNIAHMEKCLRIDDVWEKDAQMIIQWCLGHEFWSSVILSPAKFRKHYGTMYGRRVEENRKKESAKKAQITEVSAPRIPVADQDFFEQKRKEREESVPMPKDFKRVLKLAP